MSRFAWILPCVLALTAQGALAASSNDKVHYQPTATAGLPGFVQENVVDALKAFQSSCPRFEQLKPEADIHVNPVFGKAKDWQRVCHALKDGTPDDTKAFLSRNFSALKVVQSDAGLLTGYYAPMLAASKNRTPDFTVPLLPLPPALAAQSDAATKLTYSRAEINAGALADVAPIAYLQDPVEAFFLHIQGSGVLSFPDGTTAVYGFAGRNGHPYTPIGRVLVNMGALPADGVSKQSIKDWLRAHPDKAQAVMEHNASYIFFTEKPEGLTGAAGVPLTSWRSVAVDPTFVPYGALLWLDASEHPLVPENIPHFVVAQDTGAAIKGAARIDLFTGIGEKAGDVAGRLQSPLTLYILVPNGQPSQP